jgi:hypothetical protein
MTFAELLIKGKVQKVIVDVDDAGQGVILYVEATLQFVIRKSGSC